ncbi:peptide deformylase [Candidatus Dojkabacteria bacterium]|uniref:Peptide deformylase n=1 Tax=Candidatus Dojkabacteria bacterium TaxID=2099670 RepID=A0A955L550_9BACT|nr:peptide deformylase [Candidatus Dojkabacteria bacterium]
MVKEILQIGSDILTTKSEPVADINSEDTKALIRDMLDTCLDKKQGTAGLSAPQIGVLQRVCICRRTDLEDKNGEDTISDNELWEVMINPVITSKSDVQSVFWEGCLSIGVGDDQLFGPVYRPLDIEVEFTTPVGEQKTLEANGFFSHVIQHEIDHLDGVLFVTYISNPQNIWKNKELDKYLSTHGEFPPIA